MESEGPLDLIYTDLRGSSPIQSIDGFNYLVILVDHLAKYVWLYPLRLKSDDYTIFRQYKVVEIFLNRSIIFVYSYGIVNIPLLKLFLSNVGIQHLKTPPHTPQQELLKDVIDILLKLNRLFFTKLNFLISIGLMLFKLQFIY